MYNSLKKLLGIGGAMILLMGSFSFAQFSEAQLRNMQATEQARLKKVQEEAAAKSRQEEAAKLNQKMEVLNQGCRGGTVVGPICQCQEGTKLIDGICKPCTDEGVCCGIKLNTNVPFIGNCIELSKSKPTTETPGETTVTEETAFPILMGSLTKILVTIIILIGFIGILIGGVMITASGGSDSGASKGKELIGRVIIALALLGASGVILRLINPNFFG